MAERNDEEILRAILEKGGAKAKEIAAEAIGQQPATPADPPVVVEKKVRTRRKGLKRNRVAGSLVGEKYYFGPNGDIVDKGGNPAPKRVSDMLRKKEEVAEQIISKFPSPKAIIRATAGIEREIKNSIKQTGTLLRTQDQVMSRMPELFGQFELAIRRLTEEHERIVRQIIKQNEELQDQVIEALTGTKAPTKAAGSVPRVPLKRSATKATGASKAARRTDYRNFRRQEVMDRARRISGSRTRSSMAAIGGGLAAGVAAGAIASQIAGGGGGGGGAPTTPSDYTGPGVAATGNAREAIDFFVSKGWTKEQAIGIAANLEAESNFRTNIPGDGGKAYGIAQWHPDRQAKFQQVYGKNIRQADFKEQLEFVNWELNNSEKKAGNILRGAKTAAEAAALVDQHYERSSGIHRQKRIQIAQKYEKGEVPGPVVGMGGGGATNPQAAPTGAPTGTGPLLYIGDSVARGMSGAQGNGDATSAAQVGRHPKAIYEYISRNIEQLKGKRVLLSTGILNNPAQKDFIEKTLQLLKENGTAVTIAGTPNVPGSRHNHNDYLTGLASKYGFAFAGGFVPAADGVHPRNYSDYNRAAIGGAPAATGTPTAASPPAAPGPQMPQLQPQKGEGFQSTGPVSFISPVDGAKKTSGFGPRWGRTHEGVDFAGPIGTPIKAAADGRIVYAGAAGGYGNLVAIEHSDGQVTRYAHLNAINARMGEPVKQGQVIGQLGNTGQSTGPHLHFEIRKAGSTRGLPGGLAMDPSAIVGGGTMVAEGEPQQRTQPTAATSGDYIQATAMARQATPSDCGRVVIMNNNSIMSHTRTMVQPPMIRRPQEGVNPLVQAGMFAAAFGLGRALRIF